MEEKGFDSKILYNSRPIKRIITSLPEQELENRSNYIKNIKQRVLKKWKFQSLKFLHMNGWDPFMERGLKFSMIFGQCRYGTYAWLFTETA